MATTREYFDIDFGNTIRISGEYIVNYRNKTVRIIGFLCFDFVAGCLYPTFYVEDNNLDLNFFKNFLSSVLPLNWNFTDEIKLPSATKLKGTKITVINTPGKKNDIEISLKFPGGVEKYFSESRSYGRVFIYSETDLNDQEISDLDKYAKSLYLNIDYRSSIFTQTKSIMDKPLAFISHDSRDKDLIARSLADKLISSDCPVWYDEYSLNVGDSLRESIEKGLKECDKCILLLTPNFINNKGWTKTEFDSVFTRQILQQKKILLPVWSGVSSTDVYEYSPSLLDLVGIQWSMGLDAVAGKLITAIKK